VREHEIFTREDDDLYCDVPISFATAALGGEVKVPTLHGHAMLKIPAGTQSGAELRLRGHGVVNMDSKIRGDLRIRVIVEVPTKLNSEQRRKLEEFAASCGDDNSPMHRSFFEKAKDFFR
jgi:molecular chaperone DnaJ